MVQNSLVNYMVRGLTLLFQKRAVNTDCAFYHACARSGSVVMGVAFVGFGDCGCRTAKEFATAQATVSSTEFFGQMLY